MRKLLIIPLITLTTTVFSQAEKGDAIEKFAQFPGGVEKFYEYVRTNLRYPDDALRDSISGDVFIEFRLDSEGHVLKESVKVLKGLSDSCDDEAMRLIRNAPRWFPARSKSKGVEQNISFPISFRME